MKYYCKNCETTVETELDYFEIFDNCPFCEVYAEEFVSEIPAYETPEQYEKRTGKPVIDNMAVYFRISDDDSFGDWMLLIYGDAKQYERESEEADFLPIVYIVIADPPVPPPYDWHSEANNE